MQSPVPTMSYNFPGHCEYCDHLSQQTLQAGGHPFVGFFCQCPVYYQFVEQCNTEDLVCTQPQPNLSTPSSPIHTTPIPPVTTTRFPWQCSLCPDSFSRWQDRDRHETTHLPYFIHCPLPHCSWRGNRAGLFKNHWKRQDHLPYHEYYGHNPEGSQIETYDPREVLNKIKSGAISRCEWEDEAIVLVQVKAYELQKTTVWTDPWGRKRK